VKPESPGLGTNIQPVGADPVRSGLVASLNRPGGNITGVFFFGAVLGTKRLELIHELVPNAPGAAILVNPNNPDADANVRELEAAARSIGLKLLVLKAGTERDLDIAFAAMAQRSVSALLVDHDTYFISHRVQLVALDRCARAVTCNAGDRFLSASREDSFLSGRAL
jgi:putative ABC transport system substrate-binding protein